MDLGRIGIWSGELRGDDAGQVASAAAEAEALGFGALFLPGGAGGPVLERCAELLEATERIVVAPGILNVWMHEPAEVAEATARLRAAHPERFLLGLGISHAPLVDREEPGLYRKPLSKMREYLDALDAQPEPVPGDGMVLAALGPKMLDLAAERTLGAHPYFVPVEHTAFARERLGPDALLAPEQAVTLAEDPRAAARAHMAMYLTLPNYTNNLLRHGFEEADLADGGSDRLVDAIVAGGVAQIRERVAAHVERGADHVCLQVVGHGEAGPPVGTWRTLAEALL